MYERLLTALESVRDKTDFAPQIGIILGSGLGDFADRIDIVHTINYSEIEGFPLSTVSGHKGRFVFGYVDEVPVVIMQGRVHYYEGYSMEDVVLPARLMALMDIQVLLVTNAAGGVNLGFKEGTLMAISDHICLAPNPLIGENMEELGLRFPDMTNAYDKELLRILHKSAKALSIDLKEGVYIQFTGPSFETPAEVRMARILGADAVGMSTACETIAANHCGVRVCGISCITNMGAGVTGQPLTHEEVNVTAERVKEEFQKLIWLSVKNIGAKLLEEIENG